MGAPLRQRALEVLEPVLFITVALSFIVCAFLFAYALGDEPVPCMLGNSSADCRPPEDR